MSVRRFTRELRGDRSRCSASSVLKKPERLKIIENRFSPEAAGVPDPLVLLRAEFFAGLFGLMTLLLPFPTGAFTSTAESKRLSSLRVKAALELFPEPPSTGGEEPLRGSCTKLDECGICFALPRNSGLSLIKQASIRNKISAAVGRSSGSRRSISAMIDRVETETDANCASGNSRLHSRIFLPRSAFDKPEVLNGKRRARST
mmetsp:Transcript_15161/g.32493  ORF Transcript_15161/g.32493 Transcript_15161/m.32493 type:complete len:203 (+) Transcript_15161:1676-2284(+)